MDVDGRHFVFDVFKGQVELPEEGDYLVDETCAGMEEHFFVGVLEVKAEF